jgi:hypothetical protein
VSGAGLEDFRIQNACTAALHRGGRWGISRSTTSSSTGPWKRLASPESWRALLDVLEAEGEVLVELRGDGKPLTAKLLVEPDEEEIELRFDPSR